MTPSDKETGVVIKDTTQYNKLTKSLEDKNTYEQITHQTTTK